MDPCPLSNSGAVSGIKTLQLTVILLKVKEKVKGKGPVLDVVLLHDEHMLKSALQSQKWQLIGMS